ncbi:MAG: hypothetical protein SVZ03_05150 [Spirochaetota bacterium]|nr:hypothetical protein [Spirochaetota bacterium]
MIRSIHDKFGRYRTRIQSDAFEGKRFILLLITLLFFFDYIAFCYLTGRSPLDIFPAFPLLDDRERISIFLPDIDGKSILKEERRINLLNDREGFIKLLFEIVVKGSYNENTSAVVPIDTFIRKIWIHDDRCIIDVGLSSLSENAEIIPGSEHTFRMALEKTITENIPSIQNVTILSGGIPQMILWEVASFQGESDEVSRDINSGI